MRMVRAARAVRSLASVGVCITMAALIGCGGDSGKATVAGKVTYNGAPLTAGTISLCPASASPIPIPIKTDGTFVASDVPVGPMTVAIASGPEGYRPAGGPLPPGAPVTAGSTGASQGPTPPVVNIPAKYADPKTSGLTWEVKGGKNTKNFDLTN